MCYGDGEAITEISISRGASVRTCVATNKLNTIKIAKRNLSYTINTQ